MPGLMNLKMSSKKSDVDESQHPKVKEYDNLVTNIQRKSGMVTKDDFQMKSLLGIGSHGKVFLVEKRSNEKLYAMKVIKKSHLAKNPSKAIGNTMTERKLLVSHPLFPRFKTNILAVLIGGT